MTKRTARWFFSVILAALFCSNATAQQRLKEGTAGGGTNPDRLANVVGLDSIEPYDAVVVTYDQCLTAITSSLGQEWVIGAIGKGSAGITLGADGERGTADDNPTLDFRVFNTRQDARSPTASGINLTMGGLEGFFYAAIGEGDRGGELLINCCEASDVVGYKIELGTNTDPNTVSVTRALLATDNAKGGRVCTAPPANVGNPCNEDADCGTDGICEPDDFDNFEVLMVPGQIALDGVVTGRADHFIFPAPLPGPNTAWRLSIEGVISSGAPNEFALSNYDVDVPIGFAIFNLLDSQVCTAPPVNVGNPCSVNTDCDDVGGDGVCNMDTITGPIVDEHDSLYVAISEFTFDPSPGGFTQGVFTTDGGPTEAVMPLLPTGQAALRGTPGFNSNYRPSGGTSRGTGALFGKSIAGAADGSGPTDSIVVFELDDSGTIGATHRGYPFTDPLSDSCPQVCGLGDPTKLGSACANDGECFGGCIAGSQVLIGAFCEVNADCGVNGVCGGTCGRTISGLEGVHYHGAASFQGPWSVLAVNSQGHIAAPVDFNNGGADNGRNQAIVWTDNAATPTFRLVAFHGQAWDPTNFFSLDTPLLDPNPLIDGDIIPWTLGNDISPGPFSNPVMDDYNNIFFAGAYDDKRDLDDTNNPTGLFRAIADDPTNPTCWTIDLILRQFDSWRDCNDVDVLLTTIPATTAGGEFLVPANGSLGSNSGVTGLLPQVDPQAGSFDPQSPSSSGGLIFSGVALIDENPPENLLTEIACNDDNDAACGADTEQSALSVAVTNGVTLFIEVTALGFDGTGGSLDFYLDLDGGGTNNAAIVANDECTNAVVIPTDGNAFEPANQDTTTATLAESDPLQSCSTLFDGSTGERRNSHSVWYVYVPNADGTLNVKTCGSDYNTVVSVYTGSCGPGNALQNDGLIAKGKGAKLVDLGDPSILCIPTSINGVSVNDTVEIVSGSDETAPGFYEIIFIEADSNGFFTCATSFGAELELSGSAGTTDSDDAVWQVNDSQFFEQLFYLKAAQTDADSDGFYDTNDCDDENAAVNPGAEESNAEGNCSDSLDNDCDGDTDAADADCVAGPACRCADLTENGFTNLEDFATFAGCFNTVAVGDCLCSDLTGNGFINLEDFATFAGLFNQNWNGQAPPNCN